MPWIYIRHGRFVHRNRCLHVKAAFARGDNSPANPAFTTRAAITAVVAVVVVAGEDLVLVVAALVMVVDLVGGSPVLIERAFPSYQSSLPSDFRLCQLASILELVKHPPFAG